MIAVIIPQGDDKLFGALLFQKFKDFKVYVREDDPVAPDYESRLNLVKGNLARVEEPLVCIWEKGAEPDKDYLRRVERAARKHPDFDVWHVNLAEGKRFPRKTRADKFFLLTVSENVPAPLSSFVFRTEVLREKAVFTAGNTLDVLATVLACAKARPVRNVWHQTLAWTAPALLKDPVSLEKRARERIDFLRWTETFFGEEEYPLGTGDRLALCAAAVAQLYPSYSDEVLKAEMDSFQVSQGAIRKMRASKALKSAIKKREQELL